MLKGITLVSWSRKGGQVFSLKWGALWGGAMWALMSTIFIGAALMLWAFMTTGQVYHFSSIITGGILLGAFLGGTVGGMMAGNLGWLHGILIGVFYYLTIILLFILWGEGFFSLPVLLAGCFSALILAAAGGIIGVNLSVFKRKRGKYRPGF